MVRWDEQGQYQPPGSVEPPVRPWWHAPAPLDVSRVQQGAVCVICGEPVEDDTRSTCGNKDCDSHIMPDGRVKTEDPEDVPSPSAWNEYIRKLNRMMGLPEDWGLRKDK